MTSVFILIKFEFHELADVQVFSTWDACKKWLEQQGFKQSSKNADVWEKDTLSCYAEEKQVFI